MLLFALYLILFLFFFNSGTVELLIRLTTAAVVLSSKFTGSTLYKLFRKVCSIVLTAVADNDFVFCLSVHIHI